MDITVTHGLAPNALASYRGARGAGAVWIGSGRDVHVLPSSEDWAACGGTIEAPVVATLPADLHRPTYGEVGLVALGQGDGASADLVLAALTQGASGLEMYVLRIPECRLEPTR